MARLPNGKQFVPMRKVPLWMRKPSQRRRILSIYADYLRYVPIEDIAAKYRVGVRTVYRDIQRATLELRARLADNIEELIAERTQVRKAAITDLRVRKITIENDTTMRAGTKQKLLLEVDRHIAELETTIDNILGLNRKTLGTPSAPAPTPNSEEAVSGSVLIVDAKGERGAQWLNAPALLPGPDEDDGTNEEADDDMEYHDLDDVEDEPDDEEDAEGASTDEDDFPFSP